MVGTDADLLRSLFGTGVRLDAAARLLGGVSRRALYERAAASDVSGEGWFLAFGYGSRHPSAVTPRVRVNWKRVETLCAWIMASSAARTEVKLRACAALRVEATRWALCTLGTALDGAKE